MAGVVQLKQGLITAAILSFTKAIELRQDYAMAYYIRALAHRYLEHNEEALADLNAAIAADKQLSGAYMKRALLRKKKGDLGGATSDLDNVRTGDQWYQDALYHRVYLKKIIGEYHEALKDVEMIIETGQATAEHWNLKGNLHMLFADRYQAEECYSQAIRLEPDYAEAIYNRGLAYVMSYRPRQGCEDLERSLKMGYERAREMMQSFCGAQ